MTISLAFLAPNLVKAAVEGRLPRGIGIERLLRDPATQWGRQFEALGLNPDLNLLANSTLRRMRRYSPERPGHSNVPTS